MWWVPTVDAAASVNHFAINVVFREVHDFMGPKNAHIMRSDDIPPFSFSISSISLYLLFISRFSFRTS